MYTVINYPTYACVSRRYLIGAGVHLYVCDQKKVEWHFSGRLTFSNTCNFSSNLLTSSPHSRNAFLVEITLFNVHHALFVRRMTQLRSHIPSVSIVISKLTLELALEVIALPSSLADQTTSRIIAELGKNMNVRSSA